MKLLSSSSLSSSRSTNKHLDTNFYNSKISTTRCLAGVLRRILCSRSLPTYPSDHIIEEDTNSIEFVKLQTLKNMDEKTEASTTPGLVARLMGLKSMPEFKLGCHQKTQNSISRSRSLNSVDGLVGSDRRKGSYRRINSSLSFREMPTFLELEDEKFFILSFENESKSEDLRSKGTKCEFGSGELKQKRPRRKSKEKENKFLKEDEEEKRRALNDLNGRQTVKSSIPTKSLQEKKQFALEMKGLKPRKQEQVLNFEKSSTENKMKTCDVVDRVEPKYCSSEDSSPVSVLDCGRFLIDQKLHISDVDSSSNISKYRRKLSQEIETLKQTHSSKDGNLVGDERKRTKIEGKYNELSKQEMIRPENFEMCDEICRLSEAEVTESSWIPKMVRKHEDFEGVGVDLGLEILGELLQDLIDQLAELS